MYRATDEHGQVIDAYVSRGATSPPPAGSSLQHWARTANQRKRSPISFHNIEQYANNRVECDHGRLKDRLRPMRGLNTDRTASVVIRGHAFIENLRRGHHELGTDGHLHLRIATAFDELSETI